VAKFGSFLLEQIIALRGDFLFFGRRLLDKGDLGILGAAFITRFCALGDGHDDGISMAMLQVLSPMIGTGVFFGSLRLLDEIPCFAWAGAIDVLDLGLDFNSKSIGIVEGVWKYEPCGNKTFPYWFAIIFMIVWLPRRIHLQWFSSRVAFA
jgi:hypothetical protein